MRRLLVALSCLLLGLLLAGCGSTPEPTAAETSPESTEAPSSTPESSEGPSGHAQDQGKGQEKKKDEVTPAAAPVPESLDFSAVTVTGESFEGADLAGKPTLLWFWAPWCPTCRGQIPQVEGLASDYGDDVNVIGVGSLDSAEAIAGFADDVSGVTHLEDEEGELWRRFGVTEQSSFVLLGADGSVAYEAGYGGSEELSSRISDLL